MLAINVYTKMFSFKILPVAVSYLNNSLLIRGNSVHIAGFPSCTPLGKLHSLSVLLPIQKRTTIERPTS